MAHRDKLPMPLPGFTEMWLWGRIANPALARGQVAQSIMKWKRWAIGHSCSSQIFQALGVSNCNWNSCLGCLICREMPKSVICRSVILAPASLFICLLPLNKSFHLTPSPVWWHRLCTPADDINRVAAGSLVSVSHKTPTSAPISVLVYTPYSGMRKNNMKKMKVMRSMNLPCCFFGLLMMSGLGNFYFFYFFFFAWCVNATLICFKRRIPQENVH